MADLEETFWSHSTWFRQETAAVGLVSTGDSWMTVCAMSREAPKATLNLLGEVHAQAPPGTWVTGPIGLHAAMAGERDMDFTGG